MNRTVGDGALDVPALVLPPAGEAPPVRTLGVMRESLTHGNRPAQGLLPHPTPGLRETPGATFPRWGKDRNRVRDVRGEREKHFTSFVEGLDAGLIVRYVNRRRW